VTVVLFGFSIDACWYSTLLPVFVTMSDADLPSVDTVASRIACDHTRYCIQILLSGIVGLKQNGDLVISTLTGIAGDIQEIKHRDASSARLWPVPPAMIHASSRDSSSGSLFTSKPSSGSSGTSKSSSQSRKRVRSEDHDVWVKCPFCPQSHWNEKSHVQHVERSVKRLAVSFCVLLSLTFLQTFKVFEQWLHPP
jgi:hypothetical protein